MSKSRLQPPLAPQSYSPQTLPTQINAATRTQHTQLNRLITERLPLCLPPLTNDRLLYCLGLAAFAQTYFTFERIWLGLAQASTKQEGLTDSHENQLREWLLKLRVVGLERSSRLQKDFEHILEHSKGWSDLAVQQTKRSLARMEVAIRRQPHILVAYAWVMYMAIFSGGRWIRQQLANAGPDFWLQKHESISKLELLTPSDLPGFSFLSFDGDQDGEDIKQLFKARLAEGEAILTPTEREEIIITAQQIFTGCIDLVRKLDKLAWWRRWGYLIPWICAAYVVVGGLLVFLLWFHYNGHNTFSRPVMLG